MDIPVTTIASDDPKSTNRFLNALVGALKGALKRVFGLTYTSGYASATAMAISTLTHDLGSIPVTMIASPLNNYTIWATAADRRLWTKTQVFFRCNMASAPVQLVLIAAGA